MANEVALTAARIALVDVRDAEIYSFKAAAALTEGQALYFVAANGTVGVADANDGGKEQFRGIALQAVAAGQTVDILKRGYVAGFTVSALTHDDPIYLSDTAGSLSTAVGTMTVNCARVVSRNDKDLTKVLYIDANWNRIWA